MGALVLNALVPTLAQAVVSGSGNSDWVQVCSVTGVAWVKLDADTYGPRGAPGQPMDKTSSMNCPWCSLHGGASGIPPAELQSLPPLVLSEGRLPSFTVVAQASALRVGAPARAPPLVS